MNTGHLYILCRCAYYSTGRLAAHSCVRLDILNLCTPFSSKNVNVLYNNNNVTPISLYQFCLSNLL